MGSSNSEGSEDDGVAKLHKRWMIVERYKDEGFNRRSNDINDYRKLFNVYLNSNRNPFI